ncbi:MULTISPECIES: hypothetical protein [Chryseobacterium]|uniref:hypothetical protein n=1 Tax=Chryseobacterium TaxID=59732 RepID=UPI000D8CC366|nr:MULTISPECIES: hypothetical protein [unclassified Chryseobacterium]MCC3216490.1 hypothetical protein [Chryseobacterium sp. X308]PWW30877.1 hypothetical protein DEU40_101295 [Chryseobacterium sp. AG844]
MKTNRDFKVRKLNRQELKSLKAGDINRDRVCCTSNEEGYCCEWAIDVWNCRYIYC